MCARITKVLDWVIAQGAKVLLLPEAIHLFPVFSGILRRAASSIPPAYPIMYFDIIRRVPTRETCFFG
jgi:hypothetical protein